MRFKATSDWLFVSAGVDVPRDPVMCRYLLRAKRIYKICYSQMATIS